MWQCGVKKAATLSTSTLVPMYIDWDPAHATHAVMGIKAMKSFAKSRDIPTQVPPLTPGTNKKMTEALKASFASWEKEQLRLNIPKGA
ncbi:hypothetical protein B566_EDAN009345 [Ephemera danica]|nr:hypothetical protein B566_EDAN009345 [Ephemera danica]